MWYRLHQTIRCISKVDGAGSWNDYKTFESAQDVSYYLQCLSDKCFGALKTWGAHLQWGLPSPIKDMATWHTEKYQLEDYLKDRLEIRLSSRHELLQFLSCYTLTDRTLFTSESPTPSATVKSVRVILHAPFLPFFLSNTRRVSNKKTCVWHNDIALLQAAHENVIFIAIEKCLNMLKSD